MPINITKLNPKYIIFITICIVVLMVGSAYLEITSSKREVFKLLDEEALSLVKTISASSENAILSGSEIENMVNSNLLTVGNVIKEKKNAMDIHSAGMKNLLESNRIEIVMITDTAGNIRSSVGMFSAELKEKIKKYAQDFNKENEDEFIPGALTDNAKDIYFAALKLKQHNGYIFLGIDSKYFLGFRKIIGIGSLFRNLTYQKEIDYIVLQDYEGIIAASNNIKELSPIQTDEFLQKAIESDTTNTRVFSLNSIEAYEAVKPLIIENEFFGIIRVGLSMESITAANARIVRRIVIITIIIIGIGIVLFSLLLTNQHRNTLQTELKKLQSYNQKILENMADGVLAIDRSGILLFINSSAEKILSVSASQVIGKKTGDVFGRNGIENIISAKKEIKAIEIPLGTAPKKIIRVSLSFAVNNEIEEDILTIILLQDITDERNLEAQLRRNEKMAAMGELAGGVAHEVRNPLNSISIITQRLALEFEPKEDKESYIQLIKTIRGEISRINRIVEQFLRFARKPKFIFRPENISEILLRSIDLISQEANTKNIEITKVIGTEAILNIDKDQMQQAFINILRNSIQAIEQNGKIEVSLNKAVNEILIEIKDNGKGIKKENLSKIFNLYYTTRTQGTGIGLSIVNQIISEHNGRIEVESEIGKGTKLRIYLV